MQLLPFWILMGIASAYFAHKRGRNPLYWFLIGFGMSLFGFIALFLLPILKKQEEPAATPIPVMPVSPKNPDFDKAWFYVDTQNVRQGPIYFVDLWKAWQRGDLNSECLVWNEGMTTWQKAKELPELINEFL